MFDEPAWVEDNDERAAREEELRSPEGHEIVAVRYFGLTYEGAPVPSWHADGFDTLDYGEAAALFHSYLARGNAGAGICRIEASSR